MRLWHQSLIPYLDRQHLLGQHRECCALRGKGWGKKHATVGYVFKYTKVPLYMYHMEVIREMFNRGYSVKRDWLRIDYQGKNLEADKSYYLLNEKYYKRAVKNKSIIYHEHDRSYLFECINLLKQKNAAMDFDKIEKELGLK